MDTDTATAVIPVKPMKNVPNINRHYKGSRPTVH